MDLHKLWLEMQRGLQNVQLLREKPRPKPIVSVECIKCATVWNATDLRYRSFLWREWLETTCPGCSRTVKMATLDKFKKPQEPA